MNAVRDPSPAGENPSAGQGPVLLDIGGEIGAVIVLMPAELDGLEVELRPAGATEAEHAQPGHEPAHRAGHGHAHGSPRHYPHVAVVARPVQEIVVHSLVYLDVVEGEYELYQLPNGPAVMQIRAEGGAVTYAEWPGLPETD